MFLILQSYFVSFPESPFLKQAFEGEYPKLLRLYNELWARLQQYVSTANPNNVYTGGVADVVYGLFHVYQDNDDIRFVRFLIYQTAPTWTEFTDCQLFIVLKIISRILCLLLKMLISRGLSLVFLIPSTWCSQLAPRPLHQKTRWRGL